MREIEAEILRRRGEVTSAGLAYQKSWIKLENFYGIEIKDFAVEVARLSLLIAEFQCDVRYIGQKEAKAMVLPLRKTGQIRQGNALRMDWLEVCPPTGEETKLHSNNNILTKLDHVDTSPENKTDFRYSNTLGWNTFPVPTLTAQNKTDLTRCAEDILLVRETHFPATIAELYNPDKMPEDLRHAHDRNDEVLERIYIGRRFKNDSERLEKLFDLYSQMTQSEP